MATRKRKTRAEATTAPPNYGCVSYNQGQGLPADWSRRLYKRSDKMVHKMVGHEGGVPDACLSDEPDKRFQFCWVNPNNESNLILKQDKGYDYVTEQKWTIRRWRWKDGRCWTGGEFMMARPAELFFEEKEERDRMKGTQDRRKQANDSLASELANIARTAAEQHGVIVPPVITDSSGSRLTPYRRA